MFSRLLLLTALVCLASAAEPWQSRTPANHAGHGQSLYPHHQHHHHAHHSGHHHHHHAHHNHHDKKPKTIVALDEMIKRKHPAEFLGRQFIRKQLLSQKGDVKFLRLSGKEEHDVNGTISLNKQGMVLNVDEVKDGNFLVQDLHNRIVGAVGMHGQSHQHVDSHKNPSGSSYTNAVHTGRAQLSIESDLPRSPKDHGPLRHMHANVFQNYEGHANVQVAAVHSRPQYFRHTPSYVPVQARRYRRQAEQDINSEIPCNDPKKCDPRTQKMFRNITEKVKEFGNKLKMSFCKILIKASKDDKDVHVELEGHPQKQLLLNQAVPEANQEEMNKVKNFFTNIGKKIKKTFKGAAKNLMIKSKCDPNQSATDDTKTVKMDTGNNDKPITAEGYITTSGPETSENMLVVDNQ